LKNQKKLAPDSGCSNLFLKDCPSSHSSRKDISEVSHQRKAFSVKPESNNNKTECKEEKKNAMNGLRKGKKRSGKSLRHLPR
jgi:hypothetical protein